MTDIAAAREDLRGGRSAEQLRAMNGSSLVTRVFVEVLSMVYKPRDGETEQEVPPHIASNAYRASTIGMSCPD